MINNVKRIVETVEEARTTMSRFQHNIPREDYVVDFSVPHVPLLIGTDLIDIRWGLPKEKNSIDWIARARERRE
ncbi:hypothetical protein ANTQUA_LOCUS905 [Anthophora quadrimaculata]